MALAMNPTIAITFALLASLILSTTAHDNSFCDTADDKVLCAQLTRGARTWQQAMSKAIIGAMFKASAGKRISGSIGVKLPGGLLPITKISIESQCKEAFKSMMTNLRECLRYVHHDPTGALKFSLSAASFSDCVNGLSDFDVDLPEATRFADEERRVNSVLLAVASKKP